MIARCDDPNHPSYEYYGARGIGVCAEWHDYHVFCRDVGPRPTLEHTLDRVDPQRGYAPGNVRWAVAEVQASNKRSSVHIVVRGERMTLAQASRRFGVRAERIRRRLAAGWDESEAATRPSSGLGKLADAVPHGTMSRYVKHHCRCDACRGHVADSKRRSRERKSSQNRT